MRNLILAKSVNVVTKKYLGKLILNKNIRIALLFLVLLVLWFSSGFLKTDKEEVSENTFESKISVQAVALKGEVFSPRLSFRAYTEANRDINLVSKVSGEIIALNAKEGDYVEAGASVCTINAEDKTAKLEHAKAVLVESRLRYEGAIKLDEKGYQSELVKAQTLSDVLRAEALVKRLSLDIDNLNIIAPFSATIEKIPVEMGQVLAVGSVCASLVDLDPIRIVANIDFDDIYNVDLDSRVFFEIADKPLTSAKLQFISKQSNDATRSYRIEAIADNTNMRILAGLPAKLVVEMEEIKAHFLPASAISLNDQGATITKILRDDIVDSVEVSILGEEKEGLWVAGLPFESLVITVGQNYVVDGDRVNIEISDR